MAEEVEEPLVGLILDLAVEAGTLLNDEDEDEVTGVGNGSVADDDDDEEEDKEEVVFSPEAFTSLKSALVCGIVASSLTIDDISSAVLAGVAPAKRGRDVEGVESSSGAFLTLEDPESQLVLRLLIFEVDRRCWIERRSLEKSDRCCLKIKDLANMTRSCWLLSVQTVCILFI